MRTVNDSERFNQLIRPGVDGITTGNLAIIRALTRHGRGACAPSQNRHPEGLPDFQALPVAITFSSVYGGNDGTLTEVLWMFTLPRLAGRRNNPMGEARPACYIYCRGSALA